MHTLFGTFLGRLLFVLLLLSGCARPDPLNRGATVTGRVTLDGVPLAGGVVVFESFNGAYNPQSVIRLDGTYVVQEPPLGGCRVSVRTSHLKSFAPPAAMRGKVNPKAYPGFIEEEVGYYTAIPARYENPETSRLTVEIEPGNKTLDLELTSK